MLCKVNLIGYIGKGAELKFTPQGQAVCEFYLAVNNRTKDTSIANNEDKEKVIVQRGKLPLKKKNSMVIKQR